MSCLGLLEDLHRFADGMPRRNEKCYYKDGPYIVFNPRDSSEDQELAKNVVRSGNLNKVIQNHLKDSSSNVVQDQLSQILANGGIQNNQSMARTLSGNVDLSTVREMQNASMLSLDALVDKRIGVVEKEVGALKNDFRESFS